MLRASIFPKSILIVLAISLLGMGACPENAAAIEFDGKRAFDLVKKQVDFGPHPAGSPAIREVQKFIQDELKSYGLTVKTQPFKADTPHGPIEMLNIIGELPGEKSERIMITSHYDTKYFKEFRFVGANDGGSSTAALLEIARVMAKGPKPKDTIQFVFFDGEEAFCTEWDECLNGKDHTYGSQSFASDLKKNSQASQVKALILLDMIGDKGLQFQRESSSTPWLTMAMWAAANKLGYDKYFTRQSGDVGGDDHMPFMEIGIPAIDLIHLPFPDTWHTVDDTIDHISPESLKVTGDTVIRAIPAIADHVGR